MTLEQIARLERVESVAISPDGRWIAYTRSIPRDLAKEDDGPAWRELHVVGAGGESRPFVAGQVNIGGVGWLPDGSAITFIDERDGDKEATLYRIPIDGGEARRVVSVGEGVRGYSFSPDGGRVALIATEVDAEEVTKLREKGFDQVVFEEQLKPRKLWIAEIDGEAGEPLEIEGSVQQVRWSPHGERLAVSVTPRELVDDRLIFQSLRVITVEGNLIGEVDTPGKLGDWRWSPDGDYLALIATETSYDTAEGRLMVVDGDGGAPRNLLPNLEGHVRAVDWIGPDTLLFISHEGVESRVAAISVDGDGERDLASLPGLIFTALSVSDQGRLAAVASSSAHPPEVFAFEEGSGAPERLTDSNPWLADVELARQEVFEWQARDGLTLQGLLVWPLDFREGERYPLILAAHGGPEAHYSNGWLTGYSLPAQHAAAEGYFMFYPNYRGSTGRGVEFALLSQGRPAMEEFDDLVDGVDALIEMGLVDADRVGITGGSYGGYASAWAATYYSDRFAAAVMNVGLSDKISMLGTSDIPRELYQVHYRTWPWEDWDLYRNASPIRHVENAKTPILILHGDADPRVDPTQSRILYRYLTLQDNPPPVRLVLYRGEGHGNRRAASRWDYSLRLMRWMDHYLKGEGGEVPPPEIDYRLGFED